MTPSGNRYQTLAAALAGVCSPSPSTLRVTCVSPGCELDGVTISGKTITIESMENSSGSNAKVTIKGSAGAPAIGAISGANVTLKAIHRLYRPNGGTTGAVVVADHSTLTILGPTAGQVGTARYTHLDGAGTMQAGIGFGNVQGIEQKVASRLSLRHAVIAGNLRASGGTSTFFSLQDASRLLVENFLAYDNDARPNPGQVDWTQGKTAGIFLKHETCDQATFEAGSIVQNEFDLTFDLTGAGSGLLSYINVLLADNFSKQLSCSGYYTANGSTCPPITATGSAHYNNMTNADPTTCMPSAAVTTWNPNLSNVGTPPVSAVGFPNVMGPPLGVYDIDVYQTSASVPGYLTGGAGWTVDGATADTANFDIGFHKPL